MQSSGKTLNSAFWRGCEERLKAGETFTLLKGVVDYAVRTLTPGGLTVRATDPKTISFVREGREILTVNIGRSRLRIYVHPAAGAQFDPHSQFDVEKFRFWDSSYHKASGMYRAMSVWGSSTRDLPGIKGIIDCLARQTDVAR